jgi:pyruvate/2-oxoglutarate dehydrogenase complex dihydrolipoamide acyltransferase (E2) component
MGISNEENGEIELLRDAVIAVVAMARDADGNKVKLAMDILLAGTSQLGTIFQQRCTQLAKQKQPRKAKPPKAAPQKGPQQRKRPASSTDTPQQQKDTEDRSKELSSIQQGIRQADPSLADQQRALRGKVYGAQNDEVAFRKAAQAIAR